MFRTATLRRVLAEEGLVKTARGEDFDFEGSDFAVVASRSHGMDSVTLYWPLENIGRRGKSVKTRNVEIDARGGRIAWGPTFLDRVKKAPNARAANALLDQTLAAASEEGATIRGPYDRDLKGIDRSLPTPSTLKVDDIKGSDITVDMNSKPIQFYSTSTTDKWRNAGNMTYWFQVHPRFKRKLALMRNEIASAKGLDAVKKILDAESIPYDYHVYMMPGWD